MTIAEAKKLQGTLSRRGGLVTLLVIPSKIRSYPWAESEFSRFSGPTVVSGTIEPERSFRPEEGARGVYSVVLDGIEVPVQWITSHVFGSAYTLVDENKFPCAIASSFEEANRLYVERWSPEVVHGMASSSWPQILGPEGRPGEWRPSAWRAGRSGLEYPWHA